MRRLMNPYLLISFLWISLLFSCKTYEAEGKFLRKVDMQEIIIPYFDSTGIDYLYRADISAMGNDLKGILIVKKINEDEKRVALISDFGNTLLDFSVKGDEIEKEYVIDDLDKFYIVNKLKKYFHFLVQSEYSIIQENILGDTHILIAPFQSGSVYIYETDEMKFDKIRKFGRRKMQAEVIFSGHENGIADSINFISHEFSFNMSLTRQKN